MHIDDRTFLFLAFVCQWIKSPAFENIIFISENKTYWMRKFSKINDSPRIAQITFNPIYLGTAVFTILFVHILDNLYFIKLQNGLRRFWKFHFYVFFAINMLKDLKQSGDNIYLIYTCMSTINTIEHSVGLQTYIRTDWNSGSRVPKMVTMIGPLSGT